MKSTTNEQLQLAIHAMSNAYQVIDNGKIVVEHILSGNVTEAESEYFAEMLENYEIGLWTVGDLLQAMAGSISMRKEQKI